MMIIQRGPLSLSRRCVCERVCQPHIVTYRGLAACDDVWTHSSRSEWARCGCVRCAVGVVVGVVEECVHWRRKGCVSDDGSDPDGIQLNVSSSSNPNYLSFSYRAQTATAAVEGGRCARRACVRAAVSLCLSLPLSACLSICLSASPPKSTCLPTCLPVPL